MRARPPLPIDPVLPDIRRALEAGNRLVLVAPPGAGKTTVVPLELLGAPWTTGRKLILLEPRRLATRAAARRMAALLGERVGETVGYRMRLETVVGPRTRIEVVTEGVLSRMLRDDPTLPDAAAVIFDEFHERSLHADVGLALSLHSQRLVRDDLRIVVMSATLDGAAVAKAIDSPAIVSEGRAFPVATHYRPPREREYLETHVSRVVREALREHDGSMLAFLPGAGEIQRAAESLRQSITDDRIDVHPLYGDLPGDRQDAAIAPAPAGRRKVVLATNIAETSLTIEGVRIVVDSGWARTPRYSARTGLTRLERVRISRAAADQRRGRAGRTEPGVCYRLWPESEDAQRLAQNVPEILEADLTSLALELAAAGIDDPNELTWLDSPPTGALARARELLVSLRALDAHDGRFRLTPHGAEIARIAAHPRVAHMLLRGRELGAGTLACDLAALLGNRDVVRPLEPGVPVDPDLRVRLDVLDGRSVDAIARVDRDTVRRVKTEARNWRRQLGISAEVRDDAQQAGLLLSFAYPDRIARRRPGTANRYLMANGTGAAFAEAHPIASEEWLVIAETDGRSPESRIYLAAPASGDELIAQHTDLVDTRDDVRWDSQAERVVAMQRTTLGSITVRDAPLRNPPPDAIATALIDEVRRRGVAELAWSDGARRIRARMAFVRTLDPAWPDVSDDALTRSLDDWLRPAIEGARSMDDIAKLDLAGALLALLTWQQRSVLDTIAPTHIEVPSGSRIAVDYSDPAAPVLAVRLQEVFGIARTPTIAGGSVPLTLHLLSPAHRPVQVTRDLAAFWTGSYAEVRKDMRGRYPKHDWPENPLEAVAHRGRKRP